MSANERGSFIVLEGPDGAGTTTQARALAARLESEGYRAHVTAEPSQLAIGRLTREWLRERPMDIAAWRTLALLFAADRLDHVANEIQPKLDEGVHVICDRYRLSSLVYQGLHLPDAWVFDLNRYALRPDHLFLLELDLDEAYARTQARRGTRELYDDRELQAQVHARYGELGPRLGAVTIPAHGSAEDVTERLRQALEKRGFPNVST